MKVLLVDRDPLVQQALLRLLQELRPGVKMLDIAERNASVRTPESNDGPDLVVLCREQRFLDVRGTSTPARYGAVELTKRQAQVLALLVEGKPNKIISRELGLAEGTVKIHVTAVLKKLKVANRTQAALAARRLAAAPHRCIPAIDCPL